LAGQPVVVQPVVVFKKFFFRMILSYKLQAAPSIKLQAQPEVVFKKIYSPTSHPYYIGYYGNVKKIIYLFCLIVATILL
jgi:hypothetical protein